MMARKLQAASPTPSLHPPPHKKKGGGGGGEKKERKRLLRKKKKIASDVGVSRVEAL